MKLLFWGATDDVTGSMTFLQTPSALILMDCGLAQGPDETEKKNDLPLPFPEEQIHAVVITHAHLDHSGYLPRLVKKGFKGKIYCTKATAALMKVILNDSASLMKEQFYEEEDVKKALRQIRTLEWGEKASVEDALINFLPAGHILGASSVMIHVGGKKIVFSGDLGRFADPLIPPPFPCPEADAVVMESTYGNRIRKGNFESDLSQFLVAVAREKRIGIIASFAVARAQMLITLIHEFYQRHPEEKVRMVIDSPMMLEANECYKRFSYLTKIPQIVYESLSTVDVIHSDDEWESLRKKTGPLIVISSSGMLSGGKIQRHLANWQDDPKAILFLPGYQARGTPGKAFLEGQKHFMEKSGASFWHGEVWHSDAFSSHADQSELMIWVSELSEKTVVFLNHGEKEAKIKLKDLLESRKHKSVFIPTRGFEYEL